MNVYGLIGKTLSHSLSQQYFTQKFSREHISDSLYRNFELPSLNEGIAQLKKTPFLKGLNVTIPYKTEILEYLDDLNQDCRQINACNCIRIVGDKWTGFNTDITGFEKSFAPRLLPRHRKALILGTGGASNGVAFVLDKLHIEYLKVSRKKNTSALVITYSEVTPSMMAEYLVVINTTPVGTTPLVNECPELPYEAVSEASYFFDLVYNPLKTLFLSLAERRGATIENGEKMLSIQAEESWRIWNE